MKYRIENLPPGNLWKKPPEMLAHHPLGKVPYIEDDELVIFDSTVIDEYLEERYRTAAPDAVGSEARGCAFARPKISPTRRC